jgi:hypothetical protein
VHVPEILEIAFASHRVSVPIPEFLESAAFGVTQRFCAIFRNS